MVSRRQMIGAGVSISDCLSDGAKSFWEATRRHMSAWLTEVMEKALEQEMEAFVGRAGTSDVRALGGRIVAVIGRVVSWSWARR